MPICGLGVSFDSHDDTTDFVEQTEKSSVDHRDLVDNKRGRLPPAGVTVVPTTDCIPHDVMEVLFRGFIRQPYTSKAIDGLTTDVDGSNT